MAKARVEKWQLHIMENHAVLLQEATVKTEFCSKFS